MAERDTIVLHSDGFKQQKGWKIALKVRPGNSGLQLCWIWGYYMVRVYKKRRVLILNSCDLTCNTGTESLTERESTARGVTHSSNTRNVGLPENVQSGVQIHFTYPAMWLTACRSQALCTPNFKIRKHCVEMLSFTHHVHDLYTQSQYPAKGEVYTYWLTLNYKSKHVYYIVINSKDTSISTITLR